MRQKVLKIGAFVIVIALSIWNMELNETKILFTFLLSFDSLAKTETACLGECSHNTGICKKMRKKERALLALSQLKEKQKIVTKQYILHFLNPIKLII